MSYRKILYTRDGGMARITLNRAEKKNALDEELVTELKSALAESAAEAEVRVVALSGAGGDFCSGADLAGLRRSFENGPLENMADARALAEAFLAMRRHPRPIVAVVRGRALAGGCGLATACDFILAAESARFGYPEVNIGFVPAMVMALLRRSVSERRALEWIVSGETYAARAAMEAGVVNRVWPEEEFEAGVEEYLSRLAARPAAAVSLSKQLLYHMDAMGLEAALEAGVQGNAIARMTPEYREGIEKFLNRTRENG